MNMGIRQHQSEHPWVMHVLVNPSPPHLMTRLSSRSAQNLGHQKKRRNSRTMSRVLQHETLQHSCRAKIHLVSYHTQSCLTVDHWLFANRLAQICALTPTSNVCCEVLCQLRQYMFLTFYCSMCCPTDIDHVSNVLCKRVKLFWVAPASKMSKNIFFLICG